MNTKEQGTEGGFRDESNDFVARCIGCAYCDRDSEHGSYDHMVCRRSACGSHSRGIRGAACSSDYIVSGGIAGTSLFYQTGGGKIF